MNRIICDSLLRLYKRNLEFQNKFLNRNEDMNSKLPLLVSNYKSLIQNQHIRPLRHNLVKLRIKREELHGGSWVAGKLI